MDKLIQNNHLISEYISLSLNRTLIKYRYSLVSNTREYEVGNDITIQKSFFGEHRRINIIAGAHGVIVDDDGNIAASMPNFFCVGETDYYLFFMNSTHEGSGNIILDSIIFNRGDESIIKKQFVTKIEDTLSFIDGDKPAIVINGEQFSVTD